MEITADKPRNCTDPQRLQNTRKQEKRCFGERAEYSESAADMARRLLEERPSHCCSCDLVVEKVSSGGRGGRDEEETTREQRDLEALLMGDARPEDGTAGRGRMGSGQVEDRDDCSLDSSETVDEKLPYHVHIVERCPNGDPIVTFVPEPEANGKGRFIRLPVVVSKCWRSDQYRAEKSGRCVAKAIVSMGMLLVVAVVCFLAGYFTVDFPNEESTSSYRQGPVRIVVESSLRHHYLTSYSDPNSKKYQDFSRNFTKAIDGVFMMSALHADYSHCTVDSLRRGSVIVEFTIQLHGPLTSGHTKEGSPGDVETTTRDVVEGILRDAVTSGRLTDLNVDSKSIKVTQVLFGLAQGSSVTPPTLVPERVDTLKIEPGLINQRGCGTRPSDGPRLTRIVGGTDAGPGRWPWLGSMQYWLGNEFDHRCAASLLNPEWALTAAHCVDGGVGNILDHIIFGDHELEGASPSRQKVKIERIVVHPGFSISRHDNDVALLKLARRVRFDENVSPACVETEPYEAERYKECYIAGWGHTVESGNISKILQEAAIPLVGKEVCSQQFRDQVSETFSIITDNMICAGQATGGVDSCQSDSGGSLTCLGNDGSWRIVGLTSFGYGCGRPEFSGVYTRVSRYWDFISSAVRGEVIVKCEELTEPTCLGRLPYTKVFPNAQGDLALYLTLLPNSSDPVEATNRSVAAATSSSRELMQTLICLTVLPSCEETGGPSMVPCRELCQSAIDFTFAMLARCERYPTGVTSDTVFCRTGINADCDPTVLHPSTANHSVITSPYLPGGFVERSVGCTWKVIGPTCTAVVFKFTALKLPSTGRGQVIIIGTGNDAKNRSSALYKLFGPAIPRPLVVESSQAWLSFASMSELFGDVPEAFYFTVEVHVVDIPKQGFPDDICQSGLYNCMESKLCFPTWWRCDGITDCASGEDEANCSFTTRPFLNTTDATTSVP